MRLYDFPCKNCPDRHVGCHSKCQKYLEQCKLVREYSKYKVDYINSIPKETKRMRQNRKLRERNWK